MAWLLDRYRYLPRNGARRASWLVGLLAITLIPLVPVAPFSHAAGPIEQTAGSNVLLIVADDMRPDGLQVMSALGRLSDERGVKFTRAFATTPLCCPSRASILTGRYARHHGVLTNDPPLGGVEAFDDRSTLATWLQSAGVRTGLVGRYLNGYESLATPPGWDFWYALWQRSNMYYDYRVTADGVLIQFDSRPASYSTRVLSQQIPRFLGMDRDRPFFLMFTPRAPHGFPVPDPLDAGAFKNSDLPLPPSYNEEDVSDKPSWIQQLAPLSRREREEFEVFRRLQLETLLGLDRAIESTLDVLRADGRLDRTWIIFTADNSRTIGEHRLDIGKACAYEACARVPLIVVPPAGFAVPRTDDHLVANIDLAPTIAAIVGTEPHAPVDGQSLLPLIADPSTAWRDALGLEQWHEREDMRFVALRTANRKYVRYANGEEEVYDEDADPYELDNLAGKPEWAAEKGRLAGHLDSLLAATAER